MTATTLSLFTLATLAACGGANRTLHSELATGPAQGPPGRVLVVSATCGNLDAACRNHWAPSVDQIVTSALEFHGYATIDPQSLRKDEATRTETTSSGTSRTETTTQGTSVSGGVVGPLPIIMASKLNGRSVTVSESQQKTVIVEGATYDELPIEDRRTLLELAGAGSVLTTRVVVGADYGVWTKKQDVEVMVKLSAATDGEMRWSSRCRASSTNHDNANQAIEAAARCAVHEITQARAN